MMDKPVENPLLLTGQPAPGWQLPDLAGKPLHSGETRGRIAILNFWSAVAQRWPMAVKEPADYHLLKTMGVYALHMIFPDLVQLCRETNNFSGGRMYDLLIETGISVGFWHKSHGHPIVKETGARYIRAVGEYLRERLPQLARPRT